MKNSETPLLAGLIFIVFLMGMAVVSIVDTGEKLENFERLTPEHITGNIVSLVPILEPQIIEANQGLKGVKDSVIGIYAEIKRHCKRDAVFVDRPLFLNIQCDKNICSLEFDPEKSILNSTCEKIKFSAMRAGPGRYGFYTENFRLDGCHYIGTTKRAEPCR